MAFHSLLARILDNREALSWLEQCFDSFTCSILRINRQAVGRLSKSYEDHAGIASAVLAGDGEKATRLMAEHLNFGRRFLLGG